MRSKSEELMNNIVNYIDDKFINENRVPTLQEIADNFCSVKILIGEVSLLLKELH